MEDIYKSLIDDLKQYIEMEDVTMCRIILLTMQELRLYINYSKEAWCEEDLRELIRDIGALTEMQDA